MARKVYNIYSLRMVGGKPSYERIAVVDGDKVTGSTPAITENIGNSLRGKGWPSVPPTEIFNSAYSYAEEVVRPDIPAGAVQATTITAGD